MILIGRVSIRNCGANFSLCGFVETADCADLSFVSHKAHPHRTTNGQWISNGCGVKNCGRKGVTRARVELFFKLAGGAVNAQALIESRVYRLRIAWAVDEKQIAKRYYVSGMVQGVGYRYFVLRAARGLGLAGYTRNLSDGRVEVYAVGTDASLASLRAELRGGQDRRTSPTWSRKKRRSTRGSRRVLRLNMTRSTSRPEIRQSGMWQRWRFQEQN